MKIPEKKRKELEKKGKPKSPPVRSGGAMGRLRQFEKARGLDKSSGANPADDETRKKKAESD